MLIHGFTGTPRAFNGLEAFLRERGIETVAPVLPGHGTKPEDLTRVTWRDWTECGRRAYEDLASRCDAVFLVGLSMGGALALWLAGELPCAGVVSLSAPARFRRAWTLLIPVIRFLHPYWKKRGVTDASPYSEEIGYPCYPLGAFNQFMRLVKRLRARLPEIRCPALVMHSRGDARIHVSNAEIIFRELGSAEKRLLLLDHPCHVITKGEDRKRVEAEIQEFICKRRKGGNRTVQSDQVL